MARSRRAATTSTPGSRRSSRASAAAAVEEDALKQKAEFEEEVEEEEEEEEVEDDEEEEEEEVSSDDDDDDDEEDLDRKPAAEKTKKKRKGKKGPGAKKTKPPGESQNEAKARCAEMRESGMALLSTLDLDGREASLNEQGRRTLRDPEDDEYISPLNCLVRAQIEIVAAGKDHPKAFPGQIGLRCVHCADDDSLVEYVKGMEKFTSNIKNIESAVRNWHRTHVIFCPNMPQHIKPIYEQLRAMGVRAGNRKIKYYDQSNERLGIVDVVGGGVRRAKNSTIQVATTDGIYAGSTSAKSGNTPTKKRKNDKRGGGDLDEDGQEDTPRTKRKKLGKEPKATLPAMLAAVTEAEAESAAAHGGSDLEVDFDDEETYYSSEESISGPESDSDDESSLDAGAIEHRGGSRRRSDGTRKSALGAAEGKLTTNIPKTVEQLTPATMKRIQTFASASEAARLLDINRTKMSRLCRRGGGIIGDFYYRYVDSANVDMATGSGRKKAAKKEKRVVVQSPTESDVVEYIESVRKKCEEKASHETKAEKAAQSDDEKMDKKPAAAPEELYEKTADYLLKHVGINPAEFGEEKKESDGADDGGGSEATRERLIRHQLMQRIKLSSKAGVTPEEFAAKYIAQIKVNELREEIAQSTKATVKKKKAATAKKAKVVPKKAESGKLKKKKKPAKKSAAVPRKNPANAVSGHWTADEDALLLDALERYGHSWVEVADHVGTRTAPQCKSRNQKIQRKREKVP
mmetsp:Transcript_18186/g.40389  ORF Transcript_18186/g.40389 Transcript_18186/m.40389 type:complete len:744 (+) Transcript_18186:179-2410(+)